MFNARRGNAVYLLLIFLTSSAFGDNTLTAPSHYRVRSFDIHFWLDGSHSINQSGTIIGSEEALSKSGKHTENSQSYQIKNGVLKSLKISEVEFPSSSPTAINDHGQIVGSINKGRGFMNMHSFGHAFLWEQGKWQDLSHFFTEEVSSAVAINNKGEVAISCQTSSIYRPDDPDPEKQQPSYLYRNGKIVSLLGYKRVIALNNKSQVLLSTFDQHYYLWDNGNTTDIGFPRDGESYLNDMNDKLQMIGQGHKGAFLYENGHITYLDTFHQSYAKSINNRGQIVGDVDLPSMRANHPSSPHAFLWQNQRYYDLNSLVSPHLGWNFESATSINDRGQIIGTGTHWGKPCAFLMTPRN